MMKQKSTDEQILKIIFELIRIQTHTILSLSNTHTTRTLSHTYTHKHPHESWVLLVDYFCIFFL